MRKQSNLLLGATILISIIGMFASNFTLKSEYLKIDLTDAYKNYISVNEHAFTVLNISGSNGYPIDIVKKPYNKVRVLRSRQNHFSSNLIQDTLFVEFTGANISQQQAFRSDTPSGIIIESDDLTQVISNNTNNRIKGFSDQDFSQVLTGNSLSKVFDCTLKTLKINSKNNSQFELAEDNEVHALKIDMADNSIGFFQEIRFEDIHHSLTDSARWVLSKSVVNRLLQ